MALGLEGRRADEELIHEDAEAPHIHHVVMRLPTQAQAASRPAGQGEAARRAREVGLPGEPRRASDHVLLRTPRLPS